ncbi:MAG: hypothetical protein M3P22_01125 [bacterium]|nr:hypothetical protein [bacterium]
MYITKRSSENPILSPNKEHYWESFATFNMNVIKHKSKYYGFYRAVSAFDSMQEQHIMSSIGMATSSDGEHFDNKVQFIMPNTEWDKYGCEDPRVTYFEGKFYIFYTALSTYPFSPDGIRVGLAISKDLKKIQEKHLITPFNAKAMTLFPNRINGKIVVMFSAFTDTRNSRMVFAYVNHIEELWSQSFWDKWISNIDKYTIPAKIRSTDHVEVGATPIKTKYGWLVVYSHIQNYHKENNLDVIFGIEALLLDLKNPSKIVGRTRGPILVPEENYELSGYVNNIVFPSGAIIVKENLHVYYGAADTSSCLMRVNCEDLIRSMHPKYNKDYFFKRYDKNPILKPKIKKTKDGVIQDNWEAQAVFNPTAIDINKEVYILYRAMSNDNTSTIGCAISKNGLDIDKRFSTPVYIPREDFEMKNTPYGFSGCEDPRITKIGDTIYMCYTAYNGGVPRVAMTSISEKDLIAKKWNWSKPFLITPRGLDDKDTCLFGEKFRDGYFIIHRVNNEICGDYLNILNEDHAMIRKCIRIMGPRSNTWDSAKVGIASPPLKTKEGWLLLYHGVSKSHSTYRVGAVLLDLKDPAIVLARTTEPIFEPEMGYEKNGIVNNVVFPCGIIERKGLVYIYYGGGDKVVGVATMKLKVILDTLVHGKDLK